jgi:hypothetical protein
MSSLTAWANSLRIDETVTAETRYRAVVTAAYERTFLHMMDGPMNYAIGREGGGALFYVWSA